MYIIILWSTTLEDLPCQEDLDIRCIHLQSCAKVPKWYQGTILAPLHSQNKTKVPYYRCMEESPLGHLLAIKHVSHLSFIFDDINN